MLRNAKQWKYQSTSRILCRFIPTQTLVPERGLGWLFCIRKMVDALITVVAVIAYVIIFAICSYVLIYFAHEDDNQDAYFPKLVVVCDRPWFLYGMYNIVFYGSNG